mgnify:CR=1 FL=1
MKKKILTLTISKQWFDMVVSGKKKEEYRVIKGYWAKRLLLVRSELEEPFEKMSKECAENWDSISIEMAKHCFISPYYKTAPYTHVLFINGYRKDSPRIEKEIESITIGKPKKGLCPDKWLDTEFFVIKFKYRMTNEEFFNAHMGERVLYKGKDIGAYVAGYVEEKYIILGFDDYTGCILCFTSKVKNLCDIYHSYRFAKLKYLEVIKHQ